MRLIAGLFLAVTLTACAAVEQSTVVATPMSRSLVAGVGDVVLRAEGRESMPNAFGKADVFGRTRPTGLTTIQFGGMQGNKVVLLRSGITTQSDATTMNSSPMVVPTQSQTQLSGTVGARQIQGTASTTGMSYIPASGSTSVSVPQGMIPIVVDWRTSPRVPVLGRTIVIESADPNSLSYRVE